MKRRISVSLALLAIATALLMVTSGRVLAATLTRQ